MNQDKQMFLVRTFTRRNSVLSPILFNICLKNVFYFLSCDACNFADVTTTYVCDKNLEFVRTKLENHSDIATLDGLKIIL